MFQQLTNAPVLYLGLLAGNIGDIEFFGYKGLDLAAIRKALPVHTGDVYSDGTKKLVRAAVAATIGREPTDVAAVCCDERVRAPQRSGRALPSTGRAALRNETRA